MRVLLVEDDALLGSALMAGLRHAGHAVDWMRDGVTAEAAAAAADYDAAVLDLGLPRRSGMELLRGWRVRERTRALPVLVITARDRIADRIAGLDAGADDYMVKPVDLDELAARLRALQRRRAGDRAPEIAVGALCIDPAAKRVTRAGVETPLTAREFAILMALARRPGHTLSVDQLRDSLYGFSEDIDSNAVEVHVHNLRRKLGRDVVETVRGFGYRIGRA
jgi:two-component system OmpR family response regulator/two-component system response regulator QseB